MTLNNYLLRYGLGMKDLAGASGVSISTISRAASGKAIGRRSAKAIEKATDRKVLAAALVFPRKVQP